MWWRDARVGRKWRDRLESLQGAVYDRFLCASTVRNMRLVGRNLQVIREEQHPVESGNVGNKVCRPVFFFDILYTLRTAYRGLSDL